MYNYKNIFFIKFYFFAVIFLFNTPVNANEYEDYAKIGDYKEKLTYIYRDYLSVIDISGQIDNIITNLEEDTINKKEAMTEGTKIVQELKTLMLNTTNSLNNLKPLELSEENKDTESLYNEFINFLRDEIEPTMTKEIDVYEKAFLNALNGQFEDPMSRYLSTFDRLKIVIGSEIKLLGIEADSYEDDNPKKNITQLYLYSNMYILEFLDAFIYILNSFYLSESNDDTDELSKFFSNLETSFTNTIGNSEIALEKGLENLRNYKEMYSKEEYDEQTQKWVDEVLKLMDEGFSIEKEVIQTMKSSSESFTMENLAENENALNDILDDFNALDYYSYLREELAIKEADALKRMQELE